MVSDALSIPIVDTPFSPEFLNQRPMVLYKNLDWDGSDIEPPMATKHPNIRAHGVYPTGGLSHLSPMQSRVLLDPANSSNDNPIEMLFDHITGNTGGSPFVSFTPDPRIANKYGPTENLFHVHALPGEYISVKAVLENHWTEYVRYVTDSNMPMEDQEACFTRGKKIIATDDEYLHWGSVDRTRVSSILE